MKTAEDPRHQKRIEILKDLFAQSFHTQDFKTAEGAFIYQNLPLLDGVIEKAAPEWPLSKIAKVDLAILRLAVYELMLAKKAPPKVIVDEAIELAKEFAGETSSGFINGVLGTVIKEQVKIHE